MVSKHSHKCSIILSLTITKLFEEVVSLKKKQKQKTKNKTKQKTKKSFFEKHFRIKTSSKKRRFNLSEIIFKLKKKRIKYTYTTV